jgi:hypothetical protein
MVKFKLKILQNTKATLDYYVALVELQAIKLNESAIDPNRLTRNPLRLFTY